MDRFYYDYMVRDRCLSILSAAQVAGLINIELVGVTAALNANRRHGYSRYMASFVITIGTNHDED